jgi:YD repeat-containing protein
MRNLLTSAAVAWVLAAGVPASASPVDKTPSATGTVARVVASQRLVEVTLADGTTQRFQWNAETKISGTLTPGAAVTIRYNSGPDGKNLAVQITVSRN